MDKREKRRFIRHEALHLLDYQIAEGGGEYTMGRTLDVSLDGLKLETNRPIEPGTRLLITLGLGEDIIDLEGKVTHCKPRMDHHAAGIVFASTSPGARKILARYVAEFHKRKKDLLAHKQDTP